MNDKIIIQAAEEQMAEAHVRLDIDLIDSLLHPNYIIIQPGGRIESKAEVLEFVSLRHTPLGFGAFR